MEAPTLVPVLRDVPTVDLRLAKRSVDALGVVSVDHHAKDDPGMKYEDFLGETLVQLGLLHPEAPSAWAHLDTHGAATLDDLARAVEDVRERWRTYTTTLAGALLERDVDVELVRTMGRFRLERFLPKLDLEEESHIGERIIADDGSVQYLKTFRLSTAQVRRAYLMKRLAEGEWRLETAAKRMNVPLAQLADRVIAAGLAYLFTPFALAEARKQPVA